MARPKEQGFGGGKMLGIIAVIAVVIIVTIMLATRGKNNNNQTVSRAPTKPDYTVLGAPPIGSVEAKPKCGACAAKQKSAFT